MRLPFRTAQLAVLALFLVPHAQAGAETKDLSNIGATLTLGDDWEFQARTAEQREANYKASAVNRAIPANLYVISAPLTDRTLEDIAGDARDVMNSMFETVKARKEKATLSGLSGFIVRAQGKVPGGHDAYATAHGIVQRGRFYVLLIVAYHGGHKAAWKALDAAKRGFRLEKGGGEDEAATEPWPELIEAKTSGGWPADGAERDGNVITFPTHNLRWTIPEDTPFKVTGTAPNEKEPKQRALTLKGTVGAATAQVDLWFQPRDAGATPDKMIMNINNQEALAKDLAQRTSGGATLDKDVQVAGMEAAFLLQRGKDKDDNYQAVGNWLASHGARLYRIQVIFTGTKGCEKTVVPAAEKLLAGMALINEAEPVPGPVAAGATPSFDDRGSRRGETVMLRAPGVELEKPALMSRLKAPKGMALAIEGRSEDRSAYIYMDVQAVDMKALRQNKMKLEDLVAERATNWKKALGDSASTGDGKNPWSKGKWAKTRGVSWRFEGSHDGHPFVDTGFVVKKKSRAYIVRIQFGGEGAEAKLSDTRAALEKKWKWVK